MLAWENANGTARNDPINKINKIKARETARNEVAIRFLCVSLLKGVYWKSIDVVILEGCQL